MHLRFLHGFTAAGLAAMLWWAGPAAAQSCSFSNTGINFGNVNVTTTGFWNSTGTFTAQCTGTPRQTIRICPNFNEGSGGIQAGGGERLLRQGAATMRYDLHKTNGIGQVWGSYTWPYASRPPVLSMTLDAAGFGTISQTIFGRISNQQTTALPGTFSSVFAGTQTRIDYGYSASFNCSATLSPRVQSVPFIVTTTNNSSCTVTASELNFGNHTSLASAKLTTNTITANCTAGTQFEIGLNNGSSGATGPAQRRMKSPVNTSTIAYGIFRNAARTQEWGSTSGSNTVSALGTGTAQVFTGYGAVPAQTTPPAQIYADSIIVVVTY